MLQRCLYLAFIKRLVKLELPDAPLFKFSHKIEWFFYLLSPKVGSLQSHADTNKFPQVIIVRILSIFKSRIRIKIRVYKV